MAKISEILASGVGGVLPVLMARDYEKQKAQEAAAAERDKTASVGNVGSSGNVGTVSKMASGGSASARADGCAQRGKTRGKMV